MGRSAGLFIAFGSNFRVSRQLTYTPAYKKADGLLIQQRVKIPVGMNGIKSVKTGEAQVDFYTLTVWGALADICCKRCTQGSALDVIAFPGTYRSNYYFNDVMLLTPDGQPLMQDKVGFTVMPRMLRFGEEADGLITEQIRVGKRPQFWNVKNHEHAAIWKGICAQMNAVRYNGVDPLFGYAKVFLPKEGTVVLNPEDYRNSRVATLPGQVRDAFTPQPGVATAVAAGTVPAATFTPAPIAQGSQSLFGNGGFVPKAAAGAVNTAVAGGKLPF